MGTCQRHRRHLEGTPTDQMWDNLSIKKNNDNGLTNKITKKFRESTMMLKKGGRGEKYFFREGCQLIKCTRNDRIRSPFSNHKCCNWFRQGSSMDAKITSQEFVGEQDSHTISKYHPINCSLIPKRKEYFCNKEIWYTPTPLIRVSPRIRHT